MGATLPVEGGWIPPPSGRIKINVDAAVGKNTGRGSVAAVARDEMGVFVGASSLVFPGRTEAETLEALACREACALARDISARRVRVASDCHNVIINLDREAMGSYGHIVKEIRDSRKEFEELIFCHEKRSSNKEAHALARSAVRDDPGRRVWLVEPPLGLCNVLPVI